MIVILIGGAALSILNQTAISPMLPSIMGAFGVSSATAQWLVSGYTLVMALFVPLSAYFIDKFSTRKIYFGAILLFLIGSLLCALAPSFEALMIGRCLQGACAGILMPLATSIMLLVFPLEKRGTAMGIYSLITMLMPAIGPAATGALTDAFGWQPVYWMMLAISAVLGIVAIPTLTNYGELSNPKLDLLSVVLCSLGLIGVLYAASEFGNAGFSAPIVITAVLGIALLAWFAYRQLHIQNPLLNLGVFKYRRFTIALVVLIALQMVVNVNAVMLPIIVQQGLGMSATVSGMVVVPGSLAGAVIALLAGRLFDRMGARAVATTGCALMVVGYVGYAFTNASTSAFTLALFGVFCTAGLLATTTPLNAWSLGFLPDELIPHGNAVSNTLRQVGSAIGTAIFISLMNVLMTSNADLGMQESQLLSARIVYTVVAICIGIITVCVFVFVKGKRTTYETASKVLPAAQELMDVDALRLKTNMKVREALVLFDERGTTDAPIVDEAGKLVGFLSVGDVMRQFGGNLRTATLSDMYSSAPKMLSESEKIHEIMDMDVVSIATRRVISVTADDSFEEICRVLSERRVKKVPVLEKGVCVGTINRRNVVTRILAKLAAEEAAV